MTPEQVIPDLQESAVHSGFTLETDFDENEVLLLEVEESRIPADMGRFSVAGEVELPSHTDLGEDLDKSAPSRDLFGDYLKEIGKIDVLSAIEEVELAKKIEAGLMATTVLHFQDNPTEALMQLYEDRKFQKRQPDGEEVERLYFLAEEKYSSEEDRLLLKELAAEGEAAYKQMIEANLRLVVHLAKRKQGKGVEMPDLVGYANVHGLPRAVEKFDYTKGFKFSTYATNWINNSLEEAVERQARLIRVPVDVHESLNKRYGIEKRLVNELNRDPTQEEMAKEMDMTLEKYKELEEWGKDPTSLDLIVGSGEDASLGDFVPAAADTAKDVVNGMMKENLQSDLTRALGEVLSEPQLQAVTLYFGLDGNEPMSTGQIGKLIDVNGSAVAQRLQSAYKRLRNSGHADLLRLHYED